VGAWDGGLEGGGLRERAFGRVVNGADAPAHGAGRARPVTRSRALGMGRVAG